MKKTRLVFVLVLFVLIFSFIPQDANAQIGVPVCPPDTSISTILTDINQNSITKWIRDFSGADSVIISGTPRLIKTRYSSKLFSSDVNALAYVYLQQELLNLGYEQGTTLNDHVYTTPYLQSRLEILDNISGNSDVITITRNDTELNANLFFDEIQQVGTWKNKVVTLPGHGPNADEIVLMTAHMDSTSNQATTLAPGAEDNASGISALMEAARLFRFYKFDRTIKIIFFTGEEQGLWGSEAYVEDHPAEMDHIVGVVNLDMFGYDSDNDRCFELHVGTRNDSNVVGNCFTDVISNYELDLNYDYLTSGAIRASDHASFWDANVGAIEVLENYTNNNLPGGCVGQDRNPYYHTTNDKIDYMNLPVTLAIAQAGIGTTASLADPMGRCFDVEPQITATPQTESIILNWAEIEGADVYNVYRGTTTCAGTLTQVAQISTNSFEDTDIQFGQDYFYKVEAAETGAVCFSQFSNCAIARVEESVFFDIYIPLVIAGE